MDGASLDPRLRDASAKAARAVSPRTAATAGAAGSNGARGGGGPLKSQQSQQPIAIAAQPPSHRLQPQSQHSQAPQTQAQSQSQSQSPTQAQAFAFPQTPSSTAPTPAPDGNHNSAASGGAMTPPAADDTPGDAKKPRSCESCRGLKVRCEFDPANSEGSCRRCAKAGRACVVTQPTRKRQKKTDSRVAELEKKIDALTASLQATRGSAGATPLSTTATPTASAKVAETRTSSVAAAVTSPTLGRKDSSAASAANRGNGYYAPSSGASRDWPPQAPPPERPAPALQQPSSHITPPYSSVDLEAGRYPTLASVAGKKRKINDVRELAEELRGAAMTAPPLPADDRPEERSDIIEKGIMTMALANQLFARYTEQMVPHLPGVVFPPETTAAELRASRPILFLAVMTAASNEMPAMQRVLTKELMTVIAEKAIVVGEKRLEIVQALQVAVIWYWPPEKFEELKFYQLVHMAAVMAIDIGLGRKKQARGGFRKHIPTSWRDHPLRKNPPPDPTTLEARRAWLTCFFLAASTSMALHRPNLIRWTPFMGECVDVLESSPDAAPTDKYLCHLVWTHRLAEEVGVSFSMDDPSSTPNIADSRTQYALKGFERQLEKYSSSIPPELQQPTLKLGFHVLSLYMHEIATHNEFSDDCRPPLGPHTAEHLREALVSDIPLTPAHINALSACLTAIDGIFETFLSMDVQKIRCLPIFNLVRVAYATVVLIKVYFAASSPKGELGKVINKDNMKVEQHLEHLLEKFRATAADEKSRPASKFLIVLVMLRSWFLSQKQAQSGGGPGVRETSSCSRRSSTVAVGEKDTPAREQPDYNTPLQLLSEVATGANSGSANASAPANPVLRPNNADLIPNGSWYNKLPTPFVGYTAPDGGNLSQGTLAAAAGLGDHATNTPWMDTAFSADFDYSFLGDGFAQVMDWTLGGAFGDTNGGGMQSGGSMEEGGVRYVMQEPPWFQMGMGTALDGLGDGGVGQMGGFHF